jgi:putative redox protein
VKWAGGLKFKGKNSFGIEIATDTFKDNGGEESGYRPTELLLYALAGCTGIDVVRIMEKQRTPLESLEIQVNAEQSEGYPAHFKTIEVKYIGKGKGVAQEKLARAIELSESKYCIISQTIQRKTKMNVTCEVIP